MVNNKLVLEYNKMISLNKKEFSLKPILLIMKNYTLNLVANNKAF